MSDYISMAFFFLLNKLLLVTWNWNMPRETGTVLCRWAGDSQRNAELYKLQNGESILLHGEYLITGTFLPRKWHSENSMKNWHWHPTERLFLLSINRLLGPAIYCLWYYERRSREKVCEGMLQAAFIEKVGNTCTTLKTAQRQQKRPGALAKHTDLWAGGTGEKKLRGWK